MADLTTSANIDTFMGAADNAAARTALGLGTAATTAASAYEVPLTFSTGLTRTTNTITANVSSIAPLVLEDANTVGQRNGANGQAFSVYRSYTDASNFSNVSFRCNGTTFEIALVETGTGIGGITALQFNINGLPVSIPSAVDVDTLTAAGVCKGDITTNASATTGLVAGALAALTTASLVIYDGNGVAYQVPAKAV